MQEAMQELAAYLDLIRRLDRVHEYDDRNRAIIKAVWLALYCGFAAGFRFDPQEPEWPVAFIELPTGQVSWHIAQHTQPWDGHTAEEKYSRLEVFVGSVR